MSTLKVRTKKITNQVYPFALFLRLGGTKEQAAKWFEAKFEIQEYETYRSAMATTFVLTNEPSHLIWFKEVPGAPIIAHEALHSVKHILSTMGLERLQDANEEAYAYMMQWTVNQIVEWMW